MPATAPPTGWFINSLKAIAMNGGPSPGYTGYGPYRLTTTFYA
jgi:hypothetical protein